MRPFGLFLVLLSVLAPLPWFVDLAVKHDVEAVISQYLGAVALIFMGISQVLATRFRILEPIFGGLDRIYVLHKWLGLIAISALMLHDTIDAEMEELGKETWIADLAEESGEIALYGLLMLVFVTLIRFIPYEIWKKSHKFIGAFYAMGTFHFLFILKPFTLLDPLGLYLSAFCLVGIISYFYMLAMEAYVRQDKPYQVDEIQQFGDIVEVTVSPTGKGIKHKAGQFAFLSIAGERHPFTIASGPNSVRQLKFCIKPLGDYTNSLSSLLKNGASALISPAYGRFLMKSRPKTQVWIAGGVGITPFLAWLEDLKADIAVNVQLYYCVHGKATLEERER